MRKAGVRKAFVVLSLVCLTFVSFASSASAWGWGGGRHFYWHRGRWWGPGLLGLDMAITALTFGAIVETLPPSYTVVVVGGVPYYYYSGTYFRPVQGGYVVVAPPAAAAPEPVAPPEGVNVAVAPPAPENASANPEPARKGGTITVNIPNSQGGFTPIILTKYKDGYIGPQGEFYKGHPSVDQLRALYGE